MESFCFVAYRDDCCLMLVCHFSFKAHDVLRPLSTNAVEIHCSDHETILFSLASETNVFAIGSGLYDFWSVGISSISFSTRRRINRRVIIEECLSDVCVAVVLLGLVVASICISLIIASLISCSFLS